MNEDIQKRILGLAFMYPESAPKVCTLAKEEWFDFNERRLFKILKENVLNKTDIFDLIAKEKIVTDYTECFNNAGFKGTEEMLCVALRDKYISKTLKSYLSDWSKKEIEDPYKTASEYTEILLKLVSGTETEKTLASDILIEYDELRKEYGEKRETGQKYIGLETGFEKVDDLTDGVRKGHLWVIGGYTSTGKTMFALNLAKGLIEKEKKVAFYSLEMTRVEIMERLLGIFTGMPSRKITKGDLDEFENKDLKEALDFFNKNDLSVHGSKGTLNEILMSIKVEIMTRKIDCLFIDYGQLVATDDQSEYDTMRRISVELQTFAKQNKIPIILLSQISNESARNESPVIGFKGSGAIAASADLAIELKTDKNESKEDRIAKIIKGEKIKVVLAIRKNRHGKTGEVDFWFDTKNGQFSQI